MYTQESVSPARQRTAHVAPTFSNTLANKDLVSSELKRIRSYDLHERRGSGSEVARMRRRAKLKQEVESSRGSFCERKALT